MGHSRFRSKELGREATGSDQEGRCLCHWDRIVLSSGTSPLADPSGSGESILQPGGGFPNGLDLHAVGTNRPAYGVSWNVYDRLVTFGKKTLPDGSLSYDYTVVEPELAEDFTVAADRMSATFKLRKDATFHDGTPVTAKDVKWSYDRAVSVGGFPPFQMKAGALENPEQFVVVDDLTFRVDFLRPDKLTLSDMAVPIPKIIHSEKVKQQVSEDDPWGTKWLNANVAGSGAFTLEQFQPNERVVLRRRCHGYQWCNQRYRWPCSLR